ncbi:MULTISPECIES: hypothetical protein [Streptomyces]|uniref:vWA-MoxR associated protein middle region 2 domain-containing protein n=1 Tax=Streptomyces dengpaensis TaxID=2049881 RepID=A0ABN5IDX8_9ACTN|nr:MULTISPECIES: hypothetical protein [Streptomyces]AVH60465.1 hypothetical protein C4B68_37030 [Streptomyces dengpaensis]PIB07616.1 hypothetical protein B1C81_19015 [Streptomyces sp. HG99]
MRAPTPRRHVLVVAPQCPDVGLLDGLEEVAGALHGVLRDQWRGACTGSPEPSLLCGTSVTQTQIEAAIRGAAERAGRAGAVLVLVLIGHGITPGRNPTLYLMAGNSRADEIASAVNVGALLTQVLETPGLPGVFALVDTCHAGGAIPDLAGTDGGVRQGAARLSMIMSVGAAQKAYRLAFSHGVVQVLTKGIRGAGEFLRADAVLDAVRDAAPGQDARRVEYDGAMVGEQPWLARNASRRVRSGSVLGPVATEELEQALAPLGCPELLATPVTGADVLEHLRGVLPERSPGSGIELSWCLVVVDGLLDCLRTIDLLTSWPGRRLTSERLRRALWLAAGRSADRLPDTSGSELLRDAVEYLRLRAAAVDPDAGRTRVAPLADFVAALAVEDQLAEDGAELTAWADAVGVVELGDAFERVRRGSARMRLRLVVSLHAAVADDWPETLDAWLLDRGEMYRHKVFRCTPDQPGVEERLAGVLHWASVRARKLGVQLRRVEIAASAALLLRWRPEETHFGERLGERHDVVLRWSERLGPPSHLWWINDRARQGLAAMSAYGAGRAPVDWLSLRETEQTQELKKRLGRGTYARAVALEHRPQRFEQVMELLLAHAPIVLWPGVEGCVPDKFRDSLDRFWHLLPAEFSEAYRRSWEQRERHVQAELDGHEHLAQWRTVWHDAEWLDFCDWFEQFTIEGENSA